MPDDQLQRQFLHSLTPHSVLYMLKETAPLGQMDPDAVLELLTQTPAAVQPGQYLNVVQSQVSEYSTKSCT